MDVIQTVETLLGVSNEVAVGIVYGLTTVVSIAAITVAMERLNRPSLAMTEDFTAFPLIAKKALSHDSFLFRLGFPSPDHLLGLPIGQHLTLKFTDEHGKNHQRSYTPTSRDSQKGSVDFVIKVYKANVHPKFPNGGKLSQHLDSLKIGETIQMKGPKGHLDWKGFGKFTVQISPRKPVEKRHATRIGMIAGGTGITPMLQVLQAILDKPGDTTIVSLIYANQTEEDILVRPELEAMAKQYPDQFKLHYTVDKAPVNTMWKYSEGFINKEMVEKHLPAKQSNGKTQIFMCGPPPMLKHACLPALKELGFTDAEWFMF